MREDPPRLGEGRGDREGRGGEGGAKEEGAWGAGHAAGRTLPRRAPSPRGPRREGPAIPFASTPPPPHPRAPRAPRVRTSHPPPPSFPASVLACGPPYPLVVRRWQAVGNGRERLGAGRAGWWGRCSSSFACACAPPPALLLVPVLLLSPRRRALAPPPGKIFSSRGAGPWGRQMGGQTGGLTDGCADGRTHGWMGKREGRGMRGERVVIAGRRSVRHWTAGGAGDDDGQMVAERAGGAGAGRGGAGRLRASDRTSTVDGRRLDGRARRRCRSTFDDAPSARSRGRWDELLLLLE